MHKYKHPATKKENETTETYSELCQTFKRSILNIWQGSEYTCRLKSR